MLLLLSGAAAHEISALARAGKRVLHIDRNSYYGGSMAGFPLSDFVEVLNQSTEASQTKSVPVSTEEEKKWEGTLLCFLFRHS